jgi:hypothetical protein
MEKGDKYIGVENAADNPKWDKNTLKKQLYIKVKLKVSHYRSGQIQRVPGVRDSQDF